MCCTMKLGALGVLLSMFSGPCCPQDPPVQVTLAIAPATILETTGTATITATFAAAGTEELTLHLVGQQTPSTDPAGYTLSSADIVVPAGGTSGTATVTAGSFADDVPSVSVVFRITRISSATCSWDVDIPASALAIIHPGSLQVTLTPADAVTAGAKWSIDNGPWLDSGTTVPDLAAGPHTVSYLPLAEWAPPVTAVQTFKAFVQAPTTETVTITDGVQTQITRAYTPRPGALLVNIDPAQLQGSGWSVSLDPSTTNPGGYTLFGVAPGTYTVTFADVQHYDKPADQQATITSNSLTTISGTYTPRPGTLIVYLGPSDAIADGAMWYVEGDPTWYSSGESLSLSPGQHTVHFVDGFMWWSLTPQTNVTINSDETSVVNGIYMWVD
jgi:hypothetical protein